MSHSFPNLIPFAVFALTLTVTQGRSADPALKPEKLLASAQRIDRSVGGEAEASIDDGAFVRRVTLDLLGRTPAIAEVQRFQADSSDGKRTRLVLELLGDEECVERWGAVLARMTLGQRPLLRDGHDGRVVARSIAKSLKENQPWGRIVGDFVNANGTHEESGPVHFILRYDAEPAKLATAIGREILGVSLQCAECHDHPHAKWKQTDFWGLAAFFARVRRLEAAGENEDNFKALAEAKSGELTRTLVGKKGKAEVVSPRLPTGQAWSKGDQRRAELGSWLADKANPYVNRNLANRLWGEMMGASLAKDLDSPPKEAERAKLLDALTGELEANDGDVRALLGAVALTRLYQSPALPSDAKGIGYVSRAMDVDTLFASITQATGYADVREAQTPEGEAPAEKPKGENEEERPEFKVERKAAVYDDGDPPVEELREDSFADSRVQTMLNGEFIHEAIRAGVAGALAQNGPRALPASVDWLYLAALARKATEIEQAEANKLIQASDRPRDGLEDVLWTLLNSAEFLTKR